MRSLMTIGPALYTVTSCLLHEVQGECHVARPLILRVIFGTVRDWRCSRLFDFTGSFYDAGEDEKHWNGTAGSRRTRFYADLGSRSA